MISNIDVSGFDFVGLVVRMIVSFLSKEEQPASLWLLKRVSFLIVCLTSSAGPIRQLYRQRVH